jgi:hypothetical protein
MGAVSVSFVHLEVIIVLRVTLWVALRDTLMIAVDRHLCKSTGGPVVVGIEGYWSLSAGYFPRQLSIVINRHS